jgi:predicted MPP superfamily phosphohydrolase
MTEKAIWLTDIHLEFLELNDRMEFIKSLKRRVPNNIFITGDIGNYEVFTKIIPIMSSILSEKNKNIFYVLGNHDFYDARRGIDEVRKLNTSLEFSKLYYMSKLGWPYKITNDTSIIGHDSWYDAEAGDYWNTNFGTNDFNYINELKWSPKKEKFKKIQGLAKDGVDHIKIGLENLKTNNVILLMHVPPFIESSRYNGKISEPAALPYFCCPSMGEMLYEYADKNKEKNITVLCGHTHEEYEFQPLKNLIVKTGKATYGNPEVQGILSIK